MSNQQTSKTIRDWFGRYPTGMAPGSRKTLVWTAYFTTTVVGLLALAACNTDAVETAQPMTKASESQIIVPAEKKTVVVAQVCNNCGTVIDIKKREKSGDNDGIGLVVGAVIGGAVGHQIGSGRGQDAATVAGAVGGGYVGNEIEKDAKVEDAGYRILIRMDNGTESKIKVSSKNGLEEGDRVRITGNNIQKV